ncbi:MAG: hypothetical protein ACREPQ_09855 [Rhodanobacter sp.]
MTNIASRHLTRKLPSHRGKFSYARIPQADVAGTGVIYRLFRRDDRGALHCEMRNFAGNCSIRRIAEDLNVARHQLRNTVDEIDLALMGVENA